jgi:ribosomal protein S18 acetylase RimI-like enzyme
MLPFAPAIAVRRLLPAELEAACVLLNRQLAAAFYSRPMEVEEAHEQLLSEAPPSLWPVQWQQHAVFLAVRAGELVGLLDVAVGSDTLELPSAQPFGLLRFWVLPEERTLVDPVAVALLAAAGEFWRQHRVGVIKAYSASTGYPQWQGGMGLLPDDWAAQTRLLLADGFEFVDRRYAFVYRVQETLFEESVPQAGLSLSFRGDLRDRRYEIFFRRTERVATARVVQFVPAARAPRVAHLWEWEVETQWQNQNLGRWLLRRILNDTAQQALEQVLVFVRMQQVAAINLLGQHGFVEQPYRGYSLQKTMRE